MRKPESEGTARVRVYNTNKSTAGPRIPGRGKKDVKSSFGNFFRCPRFRDSVRSRASVPAGKLELAYAGYHLTGALADFEHPARCLLLFIAVFGESHETCFARNGSGTR